MGSARSKSANVFALAEILRAEKLRQADDLAPRFAASRMCAIADSKIGVGVGAHSHLHQADLVFAGVFHVSDSSS